jgi:hypothetical protein
MSQGSEKALVKTILDSSLILAFSRWEHLSQMWECLYNCAYVVLVAFSGITTCSTSAHYVSLERIFKLGYEDGIEKQLWEKWFYNFERSSFSLRHSPPFVNAWAWFIKLPPICCCRFYASIGKVSRRCDCRDPSLILMLSLSSKSILLSLGPKNHMSFQHWLDRPFSEASRECVVSRLLENSMW